MRLCALALLLAGCGGAMTETLNAPPAPPTAPEMPVWTSAQHLVTWCDGEVARAEAIAGRLRTTTERTKASTLEPFNELMGILDVANGWAGLMFNVHPDAETRKSAESCQQKLEKFETGIKLDRGLYNAIAGVDAASLDPLGRRFVEKLRRDFRRSGVDKDEPTRTRIAELNEELVKLSQEYRKNVNQDIRKIEVADAAALKGLPEDYIASHKPNAQGKIEISTDYPDFYPFETYAEDASLRAKLYDEFMQRGYPANKALLQDVLARRHALATLLGYPTWAAYMAEDKMVKTAEAIDRFIGDVATIARPRMERDLQTLLARKRKDDPKATAIEVFDRFFYVGKVRQAQHDFDARAVRPYFSYPKVKQGILDLYSELFGVTFVRLMDEPVWHPDVEAYELRSGGALLGRFFLDMHPRTDKYKHAAMFGIQTGLETERLPRAALVCNFPDPSDGDGKALMEHGEVVTFFHEFGHLVHQLLARKGPWITLSGLNVEWDFVEAPSQLLEEWGWDAGVLGRFAKHVDTGEPIPAALVQKMRSAEEFGKGVDVMRQVFYAAYSFYLHAQDPAKVDLDRFTAETFKTFSPFPATPKGFVYANFEHLIGYSSMYYTYQWSLVLAKDIFTKFAAAGIQDREVAKHYRDTILVPGGTKDAVDLVTDFLGRKSNLDAYRAWLQRD